MTNSGWSTTDTNPEKTISPRISRICSMAFFRTIPPSDLLLPKWRRTAGTRVSSQPQKSLGRYLEKWTPWFWRKGNKGFCKKEEWECRHRVDLRCQPWFTATMHRRCLGVSMGVMMSVIGQCPLPRQSKRPNSKKVTFWSASTQWQL